MLVSIYLLQSILHPDASGSFHKTDLTLTLPAWITSFLLIFWMKFRFFILALQGPSCSNAHAVLQIPACPFPAFTSYTAHAELIMLHFVCCLYTLSLIHI